MACPPKRDSDHLDSYDALDSYSSLVEILRHRAQQQPHQVAYIHLKNGEVESGRMTYQELDRQAQVIAAHLQAMGAQGSRVLLTYPLSAGLAFTAAFFGCLYAGAVAVTGWPPLKKSMFSELEFKVADAGVAFALTTRSLLARNQSQFDASPTLKDVKWLVTDELTNNELVSTSLGSTQRVNWQHPSLTASDLAYFQYTSGSTGNPKAAMITHGNALDNLGLIAQAFAYTAEDIGVCWLPLYHDMGLVGAVIQPIYVGGMVVMMSPVDFLQKPLRWLQAVSRYRATSSGGPNFAYELCVRKTTPEQRAKLDLSCWQVAANGAEPVLAETMDRFVTAFEPSGFCREAFCPAYGMAETTVMVSLSSRKVAPVIQPVRGRALENNQIESVPDIETNTEAEIEPVPAVKSLADADKAIANKTVTSKNIASKNIASKHTADQKIQEKTSRIIVGCGQIGLNHTIKIVDPETLRDCESNQVGEIWVSGPSVAQGYWNRPEETQKTFNAYLSDTGEGPFLRTGDMGFLQGDELFIAGRLKDVIILWGRNHYPHHLEKTVEQSHSALRPGCGAVFGLEVAGEEQLVVTQEVESRYLRSLETEDVVEAIQQALVTHHMVEAHAIVLTRPGSVPKTPTGKTQRAACREKYLVGGLNIIGQWKQSKPAEGIVLDPALMTSAMS